MNISRQAFPLRLGGFLCLVAVASGPVVAGDKEAGMSWEERRLFQPTASQLEQERLGGVFIYDGLDEATVDRAIYLNFERIQSMMFVRVKHPLPPPGEDLPVYLDDGCD